MGRRKTKPHTRGQLMVKDKMKLQMRLLKLISMTSIGVGLWFFISQIVHDKASVDVRLFLPFIFAGWVGDHAHRLMSVLSDRIASLENASRD
jgi:hypothetical protein